MDCILWSVHDNLMLKASFKWSLSSLRGGGDGIEPLWTFLPSYFYCISLKVLNGDSASKLFARANLVLFSKNLRWKNFRRVTYSNYRLILWQIKKSENHQLSFESKKEAAKLWRLLHSGVEQFLKRANIFLLIFDYYRFWISILSQKLILQIWT